MTVVCATPKIRPICLYERRFLTNSTTFCSRARFRGLGMGSLYHAPRGYATGRGDHSLNLEGILAFDVPSGLVLLAGYPLELDVNLLSERVNLAANF